jgi:hypothetical protein
VETPSLFYEDFFMSRNALPLTPEDNNYVSSRLRYQQLTQNTDDIEIDTDNFTVATQPTVMTFGDGMVYFNGSVIAAGTPAADYSIGTLPAWCVPEQDGLYAVNVLRAGAALFNAVKVNTSGDSIASISVTTPGSYATLPTIAVTGPGAGAVLVLRMKAVSATPSTAGTGYAPADTITLTGGTASVQGVLTVATTTLATIAPLAAGSGYTPADTLTLVGGTAVTAATLTVSTTKLVSLSPNARGTGYAPTDTLTMGGGTGTPATVTVTTTRVVSATVASAGLSGANGPQVVTGTTGTGTKFTANVVVTAGAITSVTSIASGGSYTANPTVPTAEPVTGAGLVGAQLNLVIEVDTVTVATGGSYTVNSTTFTSTGGTGTGATFNTALFGVNTVSVATGGSYTANSATFTCTGGTGTDATFNTAVFGVDSVTVSGTPGSYTALPANPVAQGSTSGSGTLAAFTVLWGLSSIGVTNGGTGFTPDSGISVSGGGDTGGGVAVINLDTAIGLQLVNAPTVGDIVYLDSINFVVDSYKSQ